MSHMGQHLVVAGPTKFCCPTSMVVRKHWRAETHSQEALKIAVVAASLVFSYCHLDGYVLNVKKTQLLASLDVQKKTLMLQR